MSEIKYNINLLIVVYLNFMSQPKDHKDAQD